MAQNYFYSNNTIFGNLVLSDNNESAIMVVLYKVEGSDLIHQDTDTTDNDGDWSFEITETGYYTIRFIGGEATADDHINRVYLEYEATTDAIVWRGTWQSGTLYSINDVVYYVNSSYICNTNHTSSGVGTAGPPTVGSYWDAFAVGEEGERFNLISEGQIFTFDSSGTASPASQEINLEIDTNVSLPVIWEVTGNVTGIVLPEISGTNNINCLINLDDLSTNSILSVKAFTKGETTVFLDENFDILIPSTGLPGNFNYIDSSNQAGDGILRIKTNGATSGLREVEFNGSSLGTLADDGGIDTWHEFSVTLINGTNTVTFPGNFFDSFNYKGIELIRKEEPSKNYLDKTSLYKLSDGDGAFTGFLTNESHVVYANSDGSVPDYSDAGGSFKVYQGTVDVTSSCTFSVTSFTGSWDPDDPFTNDNPGINSETGTYSVRYLYSNSGTITFRANYQGNNIDKTYSISKGVTGEDATRYYIKPINGTAIKNSFGSLTVEAHKLDGGTDSLLSAGSTKLYVGSDPISTYLGSGTDYIGVFNSANISDSVVVELKNGPSADPFDTITLVDITDGADGSDAIVGFIESSNGLVWTRDDFGAWNPATLTSTVTGNFYQGGSPTGVQTVSLTIDTNTGVITYGVDNPIHPDITVSNIGNGTRNLTLVFTHSSGISVSETFYSSFDGADATNAQIVLFEWTGSEFWPTSTTIDNAWTQTFSSDYSGSGTLKINATSAEGGVRAGFNGVDLGSMNGGSGSADFEFDISNIQIDNDNVVSIWSTTSDLGQINSVRVFLTLDGSTTGSRFSEGRLKDNATNLTLRSAAFGGTRVNFTNGSLFMPFTGSVRTSRGIPPTSYPYTVATIRYNEGRLTHGVAMEIPTSNVIDEASTNLSQDWTSWTKTNLNSSQIIANEQMGNILYSDYNSGQNFCEIKGGQISVSSGDTFIFSVYLRTSYPGNYSIKGAINNGADIGTETKVVSLDQVFQRVYLSFTSSATDANTDFYLRITPSFGTLPVGTIEFSYPQIEKNSLISYPTSYTLNSRDYPNLTYEFMPPTAYMTMLWWINFYEEASTQGETEMFVLRSASNSFQVKRTSLGNMEIFTTGGGTAISDYPSEASNANEWHLWGFTVDSVGSSIKIIFDGEVIQTLTDSDISGGTVSSMFGIASNCDSIEFQTNPSAGKNDVSNALWDNIAYLRGVILPDADIQAWYNYTAPVEDVDNVFPEIQVRNGGSEKITVGEFGSNQVIIDNSKIIMQTPNFGVFPFVSGLSFGKLYSALASTEEDFTITGGFTLNTLYGSFDLDITYKDNVAGEYSPRATIDLSPVGYYINSPEILVLPGLMRDLTGYGQQLNGTVTTEGIDQFKADIEFYSLGQDPNTKKEQFNGLHWNDTPKYSFTDLPIFAAGSTNITSMQNARCQHSDGTHPNIPGGARIYQFNDTYLNAVSVQPGIYNASYQYYTNGYFNSGLDYQVNFIKASVHNKSVVDAGVRAVYEFYVCKDPVNGSLTDSNNWKLLDSLTTAPFYLTDRGASIYFFPDRHTDVIPTSDPVFGNEAYLILPFLKAVSVVGGVTQHEGALARCSGVPPYTTGDSTPGIIELIDRDSISEVSLLNEPNHFLNLMFMNHVDLG
jgi:hypothetical protein